MGRNARLMSNHSIEPTGLGNPDIAAQIKQ